MCLQPSFGPIPPLPYSIAAPPHVLHGVKKLLQLPNKNVLSLAKVPQLTGFAVPQPMVTRLTMLLRVVGPQVLQAVVATGVAQPEVAMTIVGCIAGAGTIPDCGPASAAGAAGIGA